MNRNSTTPRLGFVYSFNDRTTLRGGVGQFYGEVQNLHFVKQFKQVLVAEALNDGRADFASNPFNGPLPTYEQALANVCTPTAPTRPGCVTRTITNTVMVLMGSSPIVTSHQSACSDRSGPRWSCQLTTCSMVVAKSPMQKRQFDGTQPLAQTTPLPT
jgi:hypothetical protein